MLGLLNDNIASSLWCNLVGGKPGLGTFLTIDVHFLSVLTPEGQNFQQLMKGLGYALKVSTQYFELILHKETKYVGWKVVILNFQMCHMKQFSCLRYQNLCYNKGAITVNLLTRIFNVFETFEKTGQAKGISMHHKVHERLLGVWGLEFQGILHGKDLYEHYFGDFFHMIKLCITYNFLWNSKNVTNITKTLNVRESSSWTWQRS